MSKWWNEAVIYQIYPRSFKDSNGDGEGDLKGITSKLQYIKDLGVDAIWLSPFYTSPNKDGGYDVANPRDVDPRFGNIDDAKELFDKAHEIGLRVVVDIVPNHFSSEHKWFKEALKSESGSKARNRFHFYDGKDEKTPPNNWISLFGGPSWTQTADGQWYLHLFDSSQPDLNWENLEVQTDFEETIKFWLDLGADGFRIDVAHGLAKDDIHVDHYDPQGLSDALRLDVLMESEKRNSYLANIPFFDRDGVHEIYRKWRKLFDSYGDRDIMAVAEIWVHPPKRATRYVRHDELHQFFNFDVMNAPFDSKYLYDSISNMMKLVAEENAWPTWCLSNHDCERVASRIGEIEARAMALFILGLPGSTYIYNGQELGLPNGQMSDADRQDPIYFRTNGTQKGRDGARVPLPWNNHEANFGFTTGKPWLPMQDIWRQYSVESEEQDLQSSLNLYRKALQLRKELLLTDREITWTHSDNASGVLSYRRGKFEIVLNTTNQPIELDSEVILSSQPMAGALPAKSAAWLRA
ncbi:MAG: alpha-amylase family glycosyl hydrolase [Candidatus Nanopelagicaceae bacterium]